MLTIQKFHLTMHAALKLIVVSLIFFCSVAVGQDVGGSPQLSNLDRYRLWRVRDSAVRNQDLRAIEKLIETEGLVRQESDWTEHRTAQLRKLINELEARVKSGAVESIPVGLNPQDYAFAIPRRERLDVRFAKTDGAEAKSQCLDVYAPVGAEGHPIIVWLHGGGMKGGDKAQAGILVLKPDYELNMDVQHLDSARKAADWAMVRPLCTNWNYNSFSVHLLAKAHVVTGEAKYLDSAIHKARLGVIPSQLIDGPRAGRWMDPHNARPAYHYIMMGALAQLAAATPAAHPDRLTIMNSLTIGLKCRNGEIVTQGVMTKDKAIECLLLVQSLFAEDSAFLTETKTSAALDAVCRLVSDQARSGRLPLGPRGWGEMLALLASRNSSPRN